MTSVCTRRDLPMKPLGSKLLAGSVLALLSWLVLAGAAAPKPGPSVQANKLIILSTTDVKGKTSPCG
jgi:hypothetical protein